MPGGVPGPVEQFSGDIAYGQPQFLSIDIAKGDQFRRSQIGLCRGIRAESLEKAA